MANGVTGIILAGGESRRMGRNKAFLPWGRATLIEHVIERLRPVTDEVIVAVKDARAFRRLKATVVEDGVPDAHALGGLYTGLRAASFPRCVVCACDAPFLNTGLIRWMSEQLDGFDAVIPRSARGLEPLHAIYAKSARGAIAEQLQNRQWDLKALVPKLCTKVIESEVIRHFDPEELSFFNVNTPKDLARAIVVHRRFIGVRGGATDKVNCLDTPA